MSEVDKTNLSEQTKSRLIEISKIDIILTQKLIKENHAVKKLCKYVTAFDYIDKI